jgi:nucleoid-associated protein YgaU
MNGRPVTHHGPPHLRKAFAVMAACHLAFPIAHAAAQLPTDAAAPTIDKVIIDPGGAAYIEGEGRPGDVVELVSDDVALGVATVAQSGQWRIALKPGLQAGTFWMRAEARAGAAGPRAAGDEIRINIPFELRGRAGVQHEVPSNETERATRQRAEELAEGAGQAFDDITQQKSQMDQAAASAAAIVAAPEVEEPNDQTVREGALGLVIAWLKRSAKSYREEVVHKLRFAKSDTAAPDLRQDKDLPGDELQDAAADAAPVAPHADAQWAAKAIANERAEAEARRMERAEADLVRKAEEVEKAAAEASQKEALKRKQAEELARKKVEANRRIAEDLERLRLAKEEADRAKARTEAEPPVKAPQKVTITLERFYLPGEKRPEAQKASAGDAGAVEAARVGASNSLSVPCEHGRVVHRRGRRWYVTGADDTLWDLAERFYGSGRAYPRIYRVNRKRLSSPHVVRPCLALRLPARR